MICTNNSLFSITSVSHDKFRVVKNGYFSHSTIKDAHQCIACFSIKPKNVIHIKCAYFLMSVLSKIFLLKNRLWTKCFNNPFWCLYLSRNM